MSSKLILLNDVDRF